MVARDDYHPKAAKYRQGPNRRMFSAYVAGVGASVSIWDSTGTFIFPDGKLSGRMAVATTVAPIQKARYRRRTIFDDRVLRGFMRERRAKYGACRLYGIMVETSRDPDKAVIAASIRSVRSKAGDLFERLYLRHELLIFGGAFMASYSRLVEYVVCKYQLRQGPACVIAIDRYNVVRAEFVSGDLTSVMCPYDEPAAYAPPKAVDAYDGVPADFWRSIY